MSAHHSAPDHALGILHRDAALATLDENDESHHGNHQDHEKDDVDGSEATPLVSDEGFLVKVVDGARQTDNDADEDDQRHAVANAAFANLFAQPHDESGTGGQGENGHQHERWTAVVDQIGLRLQRAGDGQGLDDTQDDGQVARVLGNLLPAKLAFLLQPLEVREDHLHQLKDDGSGDVGHDAQRENGELAEVPAAEKIEEAQR